MRVISSSYCGGDLEVYASAFDKVLSLPPPLPYWVVHFTQRDDWLPSISSSHLGWRSCMGDHLV